MEPHDDKHEDRHPERKYILGVVVIITGFVLLLTNINILPDFFHNVLISWPMLLIGIGIISFLSSESRTPGTILILIGAIFLLPRILREMGIYDFNAWQVLWPLVLIGFGVLILTKRLPRKNWNRARRSEIPGNLADGYIHEENIFSGAKQRITHQVFRGGHINCIFGGSELDLTQATLADGVSELEINAIFGGVTIIVPADWRVQLKMTSILGGFSDKRAYVRESPDSSRILIFKGSAIFGGGELKNF